MQKKTYVLTAVTLLLSTLPQGVSAHTHISNAGILNNPLFSHHMVGTPLGTVMLCSIVVSTILGIVLFLKRTSPITHVQRFGWGYAGLFLITSSLTYIPGASDAQGTFLGLFALELIDDVLHLLSALWIIIATWYSHTAVIRYFKIFGSLYLFDGIAGLFVQRGILDAGLWLYPYPNLSIVESILLNTPHILIGGVACYVGFVLSRRNTISCD